MIFSIDSAVYENVLDISIYREALKAYIVPTTQDKTLVEFHSLEELEKVAKEMDEVLIISFLDFSPDMEEEASITIYDGFME